MKHDVSTLEGALLDAAVALAEGWIPADNGQGWDAPTVISAGPGKQPFKGRMFQRAPYPWSSDWSCGGRIIERERISLLIDSNGATTAEVRAVYDSGEIMRSDASGDGWTPLVAAMRAYVASKFGDEVDLP